MGPSYDSIVVFCCNVSVFPWFEGRGGCLVDISVLIGVLDIIDVIVGLMMILSVMFLLLFSCAFLMGIVGSVT